MATVLIADDEPSICEAFAAFVESEGHRPVLASSAGEALRMLRQERPDAVFLDVRLPDRSGLEALADIQALDASIPVIVMTAHGTLQTAAEALRGNAFDYLGKPVELDQVRRILRRALHRPETAAIPSPAAAAAPGELVGQSPAMQEIFKLIVLLAGNDLTVLVQGESGVGKELVARALHAQGPRCKLPFVAVNCAAIPDSLIESELFGHEKGAFTDARDARIGRFEAAGRGTLFLDEISEMPLHLQSKLLRVLQERSFERIGSTVSTPFAARLVVASNRDLGAAVRESRFREDLFHRVNLVAIRVPPLRERREDIPELVRAFLARAGAEIGRTVRSVEPAAMERLRAREWPGNVRELEHAIKRAALLARGEVLTTHDFEPGVGGEPPGGEARTLDPLLERLQETAGHLVARARTAGSVQVFDAAVRAVEGAMVRAALQATAGNRAAAAKLLGINRTTLRNKAAGADGSSPAPEDE